MNIIPILLLISAGAAFSAEAAPLACAQPLETISRLLGMPADPELLATCEAFAALPDVPDQEGIRTLIDERQMPQWSARLGEFQDLAALIFPDSHPEPASRDLFNASMDLLDRARRAMNDYAKAIHPGLKVLGSEALSGAYRGRGIRVAVVDLFDDQLLAQQRARYPEARIDAPLTFGAPVSLDHGHSVIDQLLTLAPALTILPIRSDAAHDAEAISSLLARPDIDLVNISRALAPKAGTGALDPVYAAAFRRLIQEKIVCKSLGNTGSDLDGHLNARRLAEGLGPVSDLSAYDLPLIKELYAGPQGASGDLLVFGLNLNVFGDRIARTATVPGDFEAVASRTLGMPAEGVWSATTESFESGSSFAAPEVCGLAALLLEAQRQHAPDLARPIGLKKVRDALLGTARRGSLPASSSGMGLPTPAAALERLLAPSRPEDRP